MMARSQIGQCRPLFARTSVERKLAAVDATLARLYRRNPNKLGAKQAFLSSMVDIATRRRKAGIIARKNATQHCVAKHGEFWSQLSDEMKEGWGRRAEAKREQVKRELDDRIEETKRKRACLQQEVEEALDGPLCLRHCRLSASEVTDFDRMWHDSRYSQKFVEGELAVLQQPLGGVPLDELAVLAGYPGPAALDVSRSPAWAVEICRRREVFSSCVLRVRYEEGDMECFLKVVWALQNPFVCCFQELALCSSDDHGAGQPLAEDIVEWQHWFSVLPLQYSYSTGEEYQGGLAVALLADAVYVGEGLLVADGDWKDLPEFLAELGPCRAPVAREARLRPPLPSEVDTAVLAANPWLLDELAKARRPSAQRAAASSAFALEEDGDDDMHFSSSEESDDSTDDTAGLGDVDLDKVIAVLHAKRAAEAVPHVPEEEVPFHMKVMGGKWCMEHHGVPYDTFRVTWNLPSGKEFLFTYGFNQSCTFTLTKFGEALARILCDFWIQKVSYYYSRWDANGRGKYVFSAADVEGFTEPVDFTRAFDLASPVQQERMAELRRLKPSEPR